MSSDEETNPPKNFQSQDYGNTAYPTEDADPNVPQADDEEFRQESSPESNKIKKLVQEEDTGITVAVQNPEKRGGSVNSHYVYQVVGSDKDGKFDVRRRYSDFYELRAKLIENWPGIFIPPLPEKKLAGGSNAEFLTDRSFWLDHFMKRCGKIAHIFYSDEMQLFIRAAGGETSKVKESKKNSPKVMLERYKKQFYKFCQETTLSEKIQGSVDHYFKNLDQTIKFFRDFRQIAKDLNERKKQNQIAYIHFIKNTISDYRRKLNKTEQEEVKKKYDNFKDINKQDEFKEFLTKMKELLSELSAFVDIKNDIKQNLVLTQEYRKRQTDLNGDITKYQSMDKDVISLGLFKKVARKEHLAQLKTQLEDVNANLDALMEMRTIIYHLLNYLEFPRLVDLKRKTFALAICSYCESRTVIGKNEREVLSELSEHYERYLPKN